MRLQDRRNWCFYLNIFDIGNMKRLTHFFLSRVWTDAFLLVLLRQPIISMPDNRLKRIAIFASFDSVLQSEFSCRYLEWNLLQPAITDLGLLNFFDPTLSKLQKNLFKTPVKWKISVKATWKSSFVSAFQEFFNYYLQLSFPFAKRKRQTCDLSQTLNRKIIFDILVTFFGTLNVSVSHG